MGALEFAPSLRRSIRRYFALAWEPPDGGWAALCASAACCCAYHNLHRGHRFGSARCWTAGRFTPPQGLPLLAQMLIQPHCTHPLPPAGFAVRLPQLYGDLPPALRHKLAAQQLRPVLRELHFFPARMRSKEAAPCCHLLAAFAQPLSLGPGQPLEGESAEGGGGGTAGGDSGNGGSTGGSGSGDGRGSSERCTADRTPAASNAMYILCTGERFLCRFLCMLFVESILMCPGAVQAALVDLCPCPGPPQGAW